MKRYIPVRIQKILVKLDAEHLERRDARELMEACFRCVGFERGVVSEKTPMKFFVN